MYLINKAPSSYVLHTVLRLKELATERRFAAYAKAGQQLQNAAADKAQLRNEWNDTAPAEMAARYKGVKSNWDRAKDDHHQRLVELLEKWVIHKKMPQAELDNRLRFFNMLNAPDARLAKPSGGSSSGKTYKQAVADLAKANGNVTATATDTTNDEYQRWYDFCMKPVEKVRKLRERTKAENQAIDMILRSQLEVPVPPDFSLN
ncbi:hypothetical protein DVH05_016876 [Phytophthora capsici]|nr:hypothetical protein DVH05_016876 [Phytophthora capsici]